MTQLALALSAFVAIVGAIGVARPQVIIGFARRLVTPGGLYAAAGMRIVMGIALLFAAPVSRAPAALRVFGAVVLVAGFATPFFGAERARAMVDWWSSQGPVVERVWAGVALALGCYLVWALLPT